MFHAKGTLVRYSCCRPVPLLNLPCLIFNYIFISWQIDLIHINQDTVPVVMSCWSFMSITSRRSCIGPGAGKGNPTINVSKLKTWLRTEEMCLPSESLYAVHLFPNCCDKMVGPTVFGSRHCKNVGVGMNFGPCAGGTQTEEPIVSPAPTILNCRSQKLSGPTLLPNKREKGLLVCMRHV